jgi:hypothetical protein
MSRAKETPVLDESNRLGDYPAGHKHTAPGCAARRRQGMGKGTSMKKEKKKPKKKQ